MKSLLIPGHETSVTRKNGAMIAHCTCGWSDSVSTAEPMAETKAADLGGKHVASKAPKAPGFRAVCRLGAWLGESDVLATDPMPEGSFRGRWNRKLERNEILIPCDVEFDDREAFEEHMADLHGDREPMWDSPSLDPAVGYRKIRTYRTRAFKVKPWKAPGYKAFDPKGYLGEVEVHAVAEVEERAAS